MKRFSKIGIIFALSVCFSYTSVNAHQAIDDHVDLVRNMNNPAQPMHHENIVQVSSRVAHQRQGMNSVTNFTHSNQNIDNHETKHVGKLLWLHIHAHGGPDNFDKKIRKTQLHRVNKKTE